MKTTLSILATTAALLLSSCKDNRPIVEASYDIIPCPQSIEPIADRANYVIDRNTVIHYTPETSEMERHARFLQQYAADILGYQIPIKAGIAIKVKSENSGILLKLEKGDAESEAYDMLVSNDQIWITASSTAGIFYGIQTLRKALATTMNNASLGRDQREQQLTNNKGGGYRVSLPAVHITDAPRFAYRGMHLDVCRHFFPLDSVKAYIDMLALHNMNTFHWHLTDDQGWRIEIKQYPELTTIGSVRKGTMIARDFSSNDSIPYSGYYTQDEAREIVRYAAERHIEVIPEIEMPGHMQGALAAYPQLGCTGGPYDVIGWWGISDDVLCMGNPEVVKFCTNILDEIMEIFPSKYIHIGGDECPKVRWEKCPKCQAKVRELGLKKDKQFTAEQKLQSWFTRQIDDYLTAHGHLAIGWDEILEGGISDNAIVMSWRGIEGGIEAARQHHHFIMVPTSYCYFDYYQRRDRSAEPLAIGGYVPIEKVYGFNPLPEVLTEEEQQYIMGVQANIWTEYIHTFNHVQYMALPRMAALCEVQWCQPERKDYTRFFGDLSHLTNLYDLYQWRWSHQAYEEPMAIEEQAQ